MILLVNKWMTLIFYRSFTIINGNSCKLLTFNEVSFESCIKFDKEESSSFANEK